MLEVGIRNYSVTVPYLLELLRSVKNVDFLSLKISHLTPPPKACKLYLRISITLKQKLIENVHLPTEETSQYFSPLSGEITLGNYTEKNQLKTTQYKLRKYVYAAVGIVILFDSI